MLFHVSEDPGIGRFEPRATGGASEPLVWAIDGPRLRNYLVPRDCPRVTCYAGPATTSADVGRFLGRSAAVVAIEWGWFSRVRSSRLYCYHLPGESFECRDACAGYFVSRAPVAPVRVETIDDPIDRWSRGGVELRVVSNLWPLRDAVVASSLLFSMIRMHNALPREA